VALQFTVVVPTGKVSPEFAEHVGVTEPSTMSLAVAAPNVTTAPDGPVASTGPGDGTLTLGGVVSCTVTLNDTLFVSFCASVAVHVTCVVPSEKVLPEAGEQLTVTGGSLDVAVGSVHVTTSPDEPVASTVMSDGAPLSKGVSATADGTASSASPDSSAATVPTPRRPLPVLTPR